MSNRSTDTTRQASRVTRRALELRGQFKRVVLSTVQTPDFLANPVPRDTLLSSLIVAERHLQHRYGEYTIENIKMGVDIVLGMCFLFVYSFEDQLRLVYSFNDGFEKLEDVQMYLDEVQNILTEELLS